MEFIKHNGKLPLDILVKNTIYPYIDTVKEYLGYSYAHIKGVFSNSHELDCLLKVLEITGSLVIRD
jgi:hypothetical protein